MKFVHIRHSPHLTDVPYNSTSARGGPKADGYNRLTLIQKKIIHDKKIKFALSALSSRNITNVTKKIKSALSALSARNITTNVTKKIKYILICVISALL